MSPGSANLHCNWYNMHSWKLPTLQQNSLYGTSSWENLLLVSIYKYLVNKYRDVWKRFVFWQDRFEQLRVAELTATQRMEASERRAMEEKDRRVAQERKRLKEEEILRLKVWSVSQMSKLKYPTVPSTKYYTLLHLTILHNIVKVEDWVQKDGACAWFCR